jgi:hypothetical protein
VLSKCVADTGVPLPITFHSYLHASRGWEGDTPNMSRLRGSWDFQETEVEPWRNRGFLEIPAPEGAGTYSVYPPTKPRLAGR